MSVFRWEGEVGLQVLHLAEPAVCMSLRLKICDVKHSLTKRPQDLRLRSGFEQTLRGGEPKEKKLRNSANSRQDFGVSGVDSDGRSPES